MIRLLALLMLLALPARAEEIVLGLSQDQVNITATFEGSEILVFGAVRREAPIDTERPLGVIVSISGPLQPVTVRRKERRFGIWMNVDAVEVDHAPSFYAVATSAPLDEILSDVEDLRHKISVERRIRSVGAPMTVANPQIFTEALIRIREDGALYQTLDSSVDLEEETLFRASIALPSNLTEGDYSARIFLTRGGMIVDEYVTEIPVKKVGFERFVYNLAHDQPFVYGLMSLAIAIAAGWAASAVFQWLRR